MIGVYEDAATKLAAIPVIAGAKLVCLAAPHASAAIQII